MMRYVLVTALTLAATPLLAQSDGEVQSPSNFDAARATVELRALELDTNKDGVINRPELTAAATAAFPIYDADASGDIDVVEFKTAPFGFSDMASFRGREQAYDAAFGLVFDLFDRDEDGRLNEEDFLTSIDRAFNYADIDSDDALTNDEFLRGFITNVALRHAMR
ncbi:EF-hand domain-containing protein [Rhodobacteraceae bacterium]|nr:EF-hand domain-containing protein [Paracoccaceae bacterium]